MRRFDDFCKALDHAMEIYKHSEPYDAVELVGMVGLFEICFEQSWKAMKEVLEYAGFSESRTGSPRQILKTAYQARLIDDENLWLDALVMRNHAAHAYNEAMAMKVIEEARERFIPMFTCLKDEIKEHWL